MKFNYAELFGSEKYIKHPIAGDLSCKSLAD